MRVFLSILLWSLCFLPLLLSPRTGWVAIPLAVLVVALASALLGMMERESRVNRARRLLRYRLRTDR